MPMSPNIKPIPSASSCTRTKNPNEPLFSQSAGVVDTLDAKMALVEEGLVTVSKVAGHPGRRFLREILTIFQRWPDDYFKKLHLQGKLYRTGKCSWLHEAVPVGIADRRGRKRRERPEHLKACSCCTETGLKGEGKREHLAT